MYSEFLKYLNDQGIAGSFEQELDAEGFSLEEFEAEMDLLAGVRALDNQYFITFKGTHRSVVTEVNWEKHFDVFEEALNDRSK